jgi:uncharacterized protein (DUF4213/DUF364 family)
MILDETIDLLLTRYHNLIKEVRIDRVAAGVYMTAVGLSDGSYGLAGMYADPQKQVCTPVNREFGQFSPGKITGQWLTDLLITSAQSDVLNSVRLAAINAVSSTITQKSVYKIISDCDPADLIQFEKPLNICIVGAFQSYINRFADTMHKLKVLELNQNSLTESQQRFFVPASRASDVIPEADVLFVTGLTLVNNTIDDLLNLISAHTKVILVGPSGGLLPEMLFSKGIQIIGSVRIINPEQTFRIISEGGAGYHLFRGAAQKICIVNE